MKIYKYWIKKYISGVFSYETLFKKKKLVIDFKHKNKELKIVRIIFNFLYKYYIIDLQLSHFTQILNV